MDDLRVTDLPQDVFIHLASFLRYNDLVALSVSCSYLRSVLNIDCVWRRLVSGDSSVLQKWPGGIEDSRGASDDHLPLIPALSLQPLCDQRLLCLRQAQLVNSVRQQRFEKQTVHFTGFLDSIETNQLVIDRPCTYNGNYLFSIGYENEKHNEVVKLTHFGDSTITTENSFRVGDDSYGDYNVVTCQVIGDKLVIRQDELFKVFQIDIPTFPHLHLINVHHGPSECTIILVGNIIFSENDRTKIVRLWDVHSGQSLGELVSTEEGSYLTIVCHSTEFETVLFYSESRENSGSGCILQYSTASMAFTGFSIKMEPLRLFLISQVRGFINEKYIVVLIPRVDLYMSVCVYDRKLSALVSEKEFEDILNCFESDFFLIKDCLALRTLISVKIVNLSNLEILWELLFDNEPNLFSDIYEMPLLGHRECRYLNIANAMHLIVLSTRKCVSFWDFDLRRKLFELPVGCTDICVNDTCTKLIFKLLEKEELSVWSFGKV